MEINYEYQARSVVKQAFQMTEGRRWDNSEWPNWLHEAWNGVIGEPGTLFCKSGKGHDDHLFLETLEGEMVVPWDNFIIQGLQGELYLCDPVIFHASYEPAGQSPNRESTFLWMIEVLWGILDDIDTVSDEVEGDNAAYRARVEKLQSKRWETGITTDGQTLGIPCEVPSQEGVPG